MGILHFICCLFCYAVLIVISSFTITSLSKRELVALLLPSCCHMAVFVLCLFLTVPWVGLQCVIVCLIVAFPVHNFLSRRSSSCIVHL